MPLTLNTPEPRSTTTTIRIESFRIDAQASGGPIVEVRYSRRAGDDSELEILDAVLDQAAVTARMNQALAGGETLYTALKLALYDLLQSGGHTAAGSTV
jgi:hypothetical protein